jgi:hypothetical protein
MKRSTIITIIFLLAVSLVSVDAFAGGKKAHYELTITNITKGLLFTPILILTHKKGVQLFTPGSSASAALEELAEGGNTGPLTTMMSMNPKVGHIMTIGALDHGETIIAEIPDEGGFNYVSLASMLLPTNDGFIALNGVMAPQGHNTVMYLSPGYDAGTEINDELCENIPGPHCGGAAVSDENGEEYVHIHAGIHGIGDLDEADYDWRNPVARVVIKRIIMKDEDDD